MTIKYCILFLLISTNLLAATPNAFISNKINNDFISILNSKKMRTYKKDKVIASNIHSIYKILEEGYFNKKLVRITSKQVNSRHNFKPFRPWLSEVLQTAQAKSINRIIKHCKRIQKKKSSDAFTKHLQKQSSDFCHSQFIALLQKSFKRTKRIGTKSLKYFKENLTQFLNKKVQSKTVNFIAITEEKNLNDHNKISELISNYYLDKQIAPPLNLLQVIQINPNITKLIQLKGIEKNSIQNLFAAELNKLVNTAFEKASDLKSKNEIQKHTSYIQNYFSLNQENLPLDYASRKLLSYGKSLLRRNYYNSSQKIFSLITELNNSHYNEALFNLLWIDIVQEDYQTAYKNLLIKDRMARITKSQSSRLLYWMGEILAKNNIKKSQDIFEKVITQYPLSFYAVMAAKSLQEEHKLTPDQIYRKHLTQNNIPIRIKSKYFNKETSASLKRLKLWCDHNFSEFIDLEIKRLTNFHAQSLKVPSIHKENNELKKSIMAAMTSKLLVKNNHFLDSFKMIITGLKRGSIKLNYNILASLFPAPYWKQIKKNTDGFDPIIALSLIRQESGFNPEARSHAGARGLMQLMPTTARQFRKNLRTHHLYKPATNLKIGTSYFKNLLTKYNHNLVYVLSAYNAGESRVKRWRSKYLTSDDILLNIENIPFNETRKYVKLIFRNIFFYKLLTSKEKMQDTSSPNELFGIKLGFHNS